jgi:4-hydroxythreonine-4-phosphate dehydrogenase
MENGVNYTAGLPIVRTSPAHGTAYDIAGQGVADENSFRQAIYTALDIWRNRQNYDEPLKNPLKKLYHEKRDESEKVRFNIPKKQSKENDAE